MVGAPAAAGAVLSLIVAAGAGAPPAVGARAVLRGMVGAGADGAPPEAVGGLVATLGGAGAAVVGFGAAGAGGAPVGEADGASAALRVTRTVSFFSGTLEVCFEGFLSLSLIRVLVGKFSLNRKKHLRPAHVKPPSCTRSAIFPGRIPLNCRKTDLSHAFGEENVRFPRMFSTSGPQSAFQS